MTEMRRNKVGKIKEKNEEEKKDKKREKTLSCIINIFFSHKPSNYSSSLQLLTDYYTNLVENLKLYV